jgi:hypothetical protein
MMTVKPILKLKEDWTSYAVLQKHQIPFTSTWSYQYSMQACTLSCRYIPEAVIKENLQEDITDLDSTVAIGAVKIIYIR